MSHDPTPHDLELADRANANGASDLLGLSIRAAALHQMAIYERARRAEPRRGFYQPYVGAVIEKDGVPYHGGYYAAGVYLADYELAKRAQRAMIERDHAEALRRNDWLDRQRVRFELTDRGRAELATPDESARRIAS